MQNEKLIQFYSVNELQSSLDPCLTDLGKEPSEPLQLFSLKMRSSETDESSKVIEMEEQLELSEGQQGKEHLKKQEKKFNLIYTRIIRVCEGFRSIGEPTYYFKSVEESKSMIEKTQKANEARSGLVSKDLKHDITCASLLKHEMSFEGTFEKSNESGVKFAYESISNIGVE